MAIETLIKTGFSEAFREELWTELKAGKLLNPDFKKDIQIGDEVNVQFDDMVTMSDYTGGDLDQSSAEYASTSTVKVKINKGKSVFFKLDDAKIKQIEKATPKEGLRLAKQYGKDAREQFARAIDEACCKQYLRAKVLNDNTAITVSTTNVHQIFAKAKAELKQGDGKGHTAWVDGQMVAIISTDMEAFMSTQNLLQYSSEMAKHYKKGFAGTFMGFNVLVDDSVAKVTETVSGTETTYEYPLFGREKHTIAGGVQDEFKLENGKKVGGFDEHYWGKGVFGVKAPLAYLLVSAKLYVNFTVGA